MYRGCLTPKIGSVLKSFFSEGDLYQYFGERMTPEKEKFERVLRDYLLLELSPVDLLRMLVQNMLDPQLPPITPNYR